MFTPLLLPRAGSEGCGDLWCLAKHLVVSVVVDQRDKGETQSAMIPLPSVQLWLCWTFACWDGEPCGALSEAAGPGALSSSSFFHRDTENFICCREQMAGCEGRAQKSNQTALPRL